MQRVVSNVAVSVTDLKKSPTNVLAQADGETVAVLNHNRVMAYMVPAERYEEMMSRLDDLALIDLVQARLDEVPVKVGLDEL